MAKYSANLVGGGKVEFDDQPIGSGGEKVVFFTTDKQHVVCFFYDSLKDRMERRRRLEKILGGYNVTTGARGEYWREHYCWPKGLIDGEEKGIPKAFLRQHRIIDPPLAVVTPAYRQNFFFKTNSGSRREKNGKWFTGARARKHLPPEEKGTFLGYLQVCTKMARAVRKMHFGGLAHSDLSNKNVLIDPRNGDACIIDIDSLVVPGIAPPAVLGTPGYIAPEVLMNQGHPCIDTDRHALGVLLYETLLLRHPLEGPKINSTVSPEDDEIKSKGEKALFIEHPTDKSNALQPPPAIPSSRLGPFLAELFRRTFVNGLHNRAARPGADDYEKGLYKTFDILHPTPDGKDWFVLAPNMPLQCPYTRQKLTAPVPYAHFYSERRNPGEFTSEGIGLTIYHHLGLMNWHCVAGMLPDESTERKRHGYFAFHEGRWVLVNESNEVMQVVNGPAVMPGGYVEIREGLQLRVSSRTNARLLRFEYLRP